MVTEKGSENKEPARRLLSDIVCAAVGGGMEVNMKIIMFGAEICPDCVEAKKLLKDVNDIELDYRNITESTRVLKEFLSYRDHDEIFKPIILEGRIGIPFFILEDGTKTFEIDDYISLQRTESEQTNNSCSIDGKGQC
ncbi:MAG: glutaredoxin-like protein [Herbinix sp.]|nr:glutaredoxin-like protein [Herbinix sp.]